MTDEFPRCHYCGKYAFEFFYEDIAVCEDCMANLSGDRIWRLVRDFSGNIWVTSVDVSDIDFEIINQGTFKDMWNECQKMDDNNDPL